MTDDQFEQLVSRLEIQAQNNPAGYQFKVLLLALLGNAYLGAILLLIVALIIGAFASLAVFKAFAVKAIIALSIFLWIVIRALWVKLPPPEGTEVNASQSPQLFAMIDELRRQLGAPKFHHVLIDDDFNAGVVQIPRLGIFGGYRNYLMIGLPLMKSLTVEQFKAVLAHEFGHLAKGHGRMSNWIYRQRRRWGRLMYALETNESRGKFLFQSFINWFSPYFNAYSFPLARANEYEADATSARLTSPRSAAEALTSVNVLGCYLDERYWPHIHRQADEQPQPGFLPYSSMGHHVGKEVDETSAQGWLEQAMARKTTSSDTHPALSDRLKAIGETPHVAPPAPGHASDRLLGDVLSGIVETFDKNWRDNILPAWEERYREVQEDKRLLAELNAKHAGGAELTPDEAFDRARLTESSGKNPADALQQFRTLHERNPQDAIVCLALGARLIDKDDESGCALIERAIQLDEDVTEKGCELLRDHHWRKGREEESRTWHQRLVERIELQQAAEKERNEIRLNDKLEQHQLTDDELTQLRTQLQAIPGLRKAYLVKKVVKHFAQRPCYVFGFSVTGMLQFHNKKRVTEILQRIHESVEFPGETIIINVDGDNYRFGRKFWWMRGAGIL